MVVKRFINTLKTISTQKVYWLKFRPSTKISISWHSPFKAHILAYVPPWIFPFLLGFGPFSCGQPGRRSEWTRPCPGTRNSSISLATGDPRPGHLSSWITVLCIEKCKTSIGWAMFSSASWTWWTAVTRVPAFPSRNRNIQMLLCILFPAHLAKGEQRYNKVNWPVSTEHVTRVISTSK
jgi:hypothetical protein